MPQKTEGTRTGGDRVRLPAGVVLKPPVTLEDLKTDTGYDPEGAEEFVAFIRALRKGRVCIFRKGRYVGGYGNVAAGQEPLALANALAARLPTAP